MGRREIRSSAAEAPFRAPIPIPLIYFDFSLIFLIYSAGMMAILVSFRLEFDLFDFL